MCIRDSAATLLKASNACVPRCTEPYILPNLTFNVSNCAAVSIAPLPASNICFPKNPAPKTTANLLTEEDNPFRNIDPINILGDIYSEIESIRLVEYKNKEYLLRANINSNNLTSLVGDIIIPDKNVDIELFINDEGFVRKILIFGEVQPNDLSNTLREISFSNWNVEIEWNEP